MTIPTTRDLDKEQFDQPVISQPSDETMLCALFGSSVARVRGVQRCGRLILDALDDEKREILRNLADPDNPDKDTLDRLRLIAMSETMVKNRVRRTVALGREVGMIQNHGQQTYEMACSRYNQESEMI